MTDEEVKKGLECCTKDGTIEELCKGQCPYYEDCHTRTGDDKRIYADALALINRLESDLYCAEAKAQGKTAKDILQSLAQFRAVSPALSKAWYALAEKYGVEVK